VLVVGAHYAPDPTGVAPYTTAMCADLALLGARVSVVTGIPHYPAWRPAAGYRLGLRWQERHGDIEVTRVRHAVPRRQDPLRRATYEVTFWAGARLAVRRARPDLVVAITPNLGAVPAAVSAGRAAGAPVGVVVQDLVGLAATQSGMRYGRSVGALASSLEGWCLRQADLLGLISPFFQPPLLAVGIPADRMFHLPNYTHIAPVAADPAAARRELGWPADLRLVLHTGNMGLKQDLGNVLAAARRARRQHPELLFLLVGDGSMRADLQRQARGLDNVRFVDLLPGPRYPVALAAADCLLVNERPSVRDMSLPSKLTSYFAAARPVVAATRPDGATAAEVRRAGAGLVVPPGDPDALLAGCVQICADPGLAAELGRAGRAHAGAALSRGAARMRLAAFLRQLAGDERRGPAPPLSRGRTRRRTAASDRSGDR
jgi:colanic acid biosynthesis glycosyl transferase WcaI